MTSLGDGVERALWGSITCALVGWSANRKYPFHPSDGPPTAILPLHWASPAPATIVRRSGRSRAVKIAEEPPRPTGRSTGLKTRHYRGLKRGAIFLPPSSLYYTVTVSPFL